MTDLAVITPSRGRPQQLAAMLASVFETAVVDVTVHIGLDDDDDADYLADLLGKDYNAVVYRGERRSLAGWTNHLVEQALDSVRPTRYLASLGDDHRPRTHGWDRRLIDAIEQLDGPGFAYGNDLYQGPRMPTAWVVSAELVRALGWMMLPGCQHMFVDNAVLALGRATDRIVYCPDVVVEHLHPYAGKAGWDDSYRASNAPGRFAADQAAYEQWLQQGLDTDADTVRTLHWEGARPPWMTTPLPSRT